MSRSQINLQDAFLNHVRKEKIPVVINISGGGKIEGLVKGFDNFVILVKHEGQHLIYKHAINFIIPEKAVELAGHSHAEPEVKEQAQEPSRPAPASEPPAALTPAPVQADPVTITTDAETPAVPPAESEEPWVEG